MIPELPHTKHRNHMEDKVLIDEILQGDTARYKFLVEKYQDKVAAVVMPLVQDRSIAEEIGQDVFVKFYRHLAKFRFESKLDTYLVRIALNLCYTHLKRKQRWRHIFSSSTEPTEPTNTLQASEFASLDNAEAVHWAMQKLKPHERLVVSLRHLQEYSTKETAEILQVPIGTVLSRLSRAQQRLKTILKQELDL